MDCASPGYRWIHKGELLEEGDLAWGHCGNGKVGWGVIPPWLVGQAYRPELETHPPLAIRREDGCRLQTTAKRT